MKNKLVLPVMALVGAGVLLYTVAQVSAQTSGGGYPPIVTRLAQKFGLAEADVKAVFDEERATHRAEMERKLEERLTQAVTEGKLTEAQKQALMTKMQEYKAQHESSHDQFKNMTPDQRENAMQTHRADMEKWAQEQGIDLSILIGYMKPFGHVRGGWHK